MATLFGLHPAPPAGARVLELGCASGGNLVPLAVRHPEARFVGVDLSARQIAQGQAEVEALGLRNCALVHADLATFTAEAGAFDYVICHGVYAWVPPMVQRAILDLCRRCLTPQGVAYVSTNTLPGWRMYQGVRDAMRFFTAHLDDPRAQVARGVGLLELHARFVPEEHVAWRHALAELVHTLAQHDDAYVFHELLEEHNEPAWLVDLHGQVRAAGLQYLADAHVPSMLPQLWGGDVAQALAGLTQELVVAEQYLDLLRGRCFRRMLLVHEEARPVRDLRTLDLSPFHATAVAEHRPAQPGVPESFWGAEQGVVIDDEGTNALLRALSAHAPATVPVPTLGREVGLEGPALLQAVTTGFLLDLLELTVDPPAHTPRASARPRAWSYARHLGARTSRVCSLRHEVVDLDALDHHLLLQLDGHTDAATLLARLRAHVAAFEEATGQPHPYAGVDAATVAARLDQLAAWALLDA